MTPEVKVKKKVREVLDQMKVYHFPPFSGGYGRSGVPDIVACIGGVFVGIECKAGKGKLTEIQKFNLQQIEQCGGIALVINEENVGELKDTLIRRLYEIQGRWERAHGST